MSDAPEFTPPPRKRASLPRLSREGFEALLLLGAFAVYAGLFYLGLTVWDAVGATRAALPVFTAYAVGTMIGLVWLMLRLRPRLAARAGLAQISAPADPSAPSDPAP